MTAPTDTNRTSDLVFTAAANDVLAERRRQIEQEQWTPGNDNNYTERELARASASYLDHYISRQWLIDGYSDGEQRYRDEPSPDRWPWDEKWWKPKNPRRDLVRAAALLLAEIERLDRMESGT